MGLGPSQGFFIVNTVTKETKEFSIQDWILIGIYIVNCEYNFTTREDSTIQSSNEIPSVPTR